MSKKLVRKNLLEKFKYEVAQEMGLNKNKILKKQKRTGK